MSPPSTESAPMPKYICHKVVSALKIKRVDLAGLNTDRLFPEDPRFAPFEVDSKWVEEKKAVAPGYYVQYEDGYTSWSPAAAFEKGYTLYDPGVHQAQDISLRAANERESRIVALKGERDAFKARAYSLATALTNTTKAMEACIALADSELVRSEPTGFGSTPMATPVERYGYYVPPCGCKGFFHDSSCSDQNPLDPFGSISNPDNRARVLAMAELWAVRRNGV